MSDNALQKLKAELPQLFAPVSATNWHEDFFKTEINKPEHVYGTPEKTEQLDSNSSDPSSFIDLELAALDLLRGPIFSFETPSGHIGNHPGAPIIDFPPGKPPTDALAFYIPFHYNPDCWGIYIHFDGMLFLAQKIFNFDQSKISPIQAIIASRLFLYSHEYFHYKVECFASRLELSHRTPLYIGGFSKLYKNSLQSGSCREEALAEAIALQVIKNKLKHGFINKALNDIVKNGLPSYCDGINFINKKIFHIGQSEFSEQNIHECFPSMAAINPLLWQEFSHGYSALTNIKPRVNYLVQANRLPSLRGVRFRLRKRELINKLDALVGFKYDRAGSNHDIYRTNNGKQIPIPRHPGDLGLGLIKTIIKQAGLTCGLREFLSTA